MATDGPLLDVRGLSVSFPAPRGERLTVASGVTFDVGAGEVVGLVGESGSGKTVSSLAISGLVAAQGGRVEGSARLDGTELVGLPEKELRQLRGARVSMVFQQAIRSLNPGLTVGEQIAETVRRHRQVSRKAAWDRAVEMLDRVGIANPSARAQEYPHQFSGGMCQRVMIAMALCCDPRLLIADEPTTALDVTVQRRILDLLLELRAEQDIAILFITHDLGVIAEMCDRVVVMYAGEVVERGTMLDLFRRPRHPYTQGLLDAIPRGRGRRLVSIPGTVPPPMALPSGCRFAARCPYAEPGRCDAEHPPLRQVGDGSSGTREARCVRAEELELSGVVTA
ncbi:ABC transporter ATP-binding protein [Phytohabitans sp. ZYX-F-186]|uniref:ABC transporter ATP-binding protein n=1 Tax=Phytohabitans maris TaxID=3071409 RepID=A0ABU0ZYL0_9ACTN|nr:ABC transporter ATP-binding protein [Phytohabitans sp. ZYX-F-186]MDQ7911270.1 ABC transporter ATP-binding protein [Phytohabitans sp. ZYX-F-186]